MKKLKKKTTNQNLIFFSIEDLICANKKCTVIDQNNLLVKDHDHWSYQGFIYYGKMLAKNKFLDIILENSNLPR